MLNIAVVLSCSATEKYDQIADDMSDFLSKTAEMNKSLVNKLFPYRSSCWPRKTVNYRLSCQLNFFYLVHHCVKTRIICLPNRM